MANFDYNEQSHADPSGDELYSVPVKAGKRIYYFDVKSTRGGDHYITITESRKRSLRDGTFVIDKHKIHLYKEDFEKFSDGFSQALDYIKREHPDGEHAQQEQTIAGVSTMSDDDFFNSL